MLGERVEERAGGAVVGLAWTAKDSGQRGEKDKGIELSIAREFVQVQGRLALGRGDAADALDGQVPEQAIVDDVGGMEDGGERKIGGDGDEELLDGVSVTDVACGEGDAGSESCELCDKL